MEYVEGGTLAQRLDDGRLDAAALRELACDLLAALGCVHGAGVLHRDVKPANVVGTLRFLAPELIDGAPPSRRSDLDALGVLLREAEPARDGLRAAEPSADAFLAATTTPASQGRSQAERTVDKRLALLTRSVEAATNHR